MIRRIHVAVDEAPASRVAQDLAIALAKQRSAAITGVSVIDQPWAPAPQAVPIGGSAFKVHRAALGSRPRQARPFSPSAPFFAAQLAQQ